MVEELLQLLVGVVDTQLLKRVQLEEEEEEGCYYTDTGVYVLNIRRLIERLWAGHLEDLKAGDVQDADEGGALPLGAVQGLVDAVDQPAEQTLVRGLGQGLHRKVCLETRDQGTGQMTGLDGSIRFDLI